MIRDHDKALELSFQSASDLCVELKTLWARGVTQFFVENSRLNVWILRYVE